MSEGSSFEDSRAALEALIAPSIGLGFGAHDVSGSQ
jgi:hypothetical protein